MKKSRSVSKLKKVKVSVKRYSDMTLYTRPNTTDDKVIIEVLKTCVYEKPSIDFLLRKTKNG